MPRKAGISGCVVAKGGGFVFCFGGLGAVSLARQHATSSVPKRKLDRGRTTGHPFVGRSDDDAHVR